MPPEAKRRLTLVTPRPRPEDDETSPYDREQMIAFANQIQHERHWQTLLKQAPPDKREELERTIGPLLKWRAARCHSPSCTSGLPPIYRPVLIVRKRPEDDPVWAPVELLLCEDCKAVAQVEHFLSDRIWSQIIYQCVKAAEPVPLRGLTTLTFDRLQ